MTKKQIELVEAHYNIMNNENIIIWVYTNASGFLWGISKLDSGTDLGWSDFYGDCKMSKTFTTYDKALEDAITLIDKCSLVKFRKETNNSHWGLYSNYLNKNYR